MDLKDIISVVTKDAPKSNTLGSGIRDDAEHTVSTLFGNIGGGQLEFVKLEMFITRIENKYTHMVRLYFTNHDVDSTYTFLEVKQLKDNRYFIIEVPIYE